MDHALLVSFLDGKTTPEDFSSLINEEVDACVEGIRSPAKVGYIIVTDGPQTTVTREHMRRLLRCMLDRSVPWQSANYTGDCLMMSEDFQPEDEAVVEAIEFVADDSRPPTVVETQRALAALG
ncbi:hypothetical protein [Novosphingobium sp.]|uniref:hypothetical protein n=1 Tax=Novosphingobium sp. TaxID=1874826 RepID=UPI0025F2E1C7|nr:hypothetical protein [Novosphingobium sp.]